MCLSIILGGKTEVFICRILTWKSRYIIWSAADKSNKQFQEALFYIQFTSSKGTGGESMNAQWTYFVVVLCFSMTSSAVLDLHRNEVNRHSDEPSDVKRDEIQTPPIDFPLVINNVSGKPINDSICRELCKTGDGGNACLCDWSPLKKQIFLSLKLIHKEAPLPFVKFPTSKDEPSCKLLCQHGEDGHFCLCP